ncbi:unnamed protein product [Brassica rapa]|uniref:Uncharacterized protein n=1 Tax=Brassica campestris TaxID=3711 RepID=A0A8D9HH71_BRACM|nr:unnamed protein product [Brassica rapa]
MDILRVSGVQEEQNSEKKWLCYRLDKQALVIFVKFSGDESLEKIEEEKEEEEKEKEKEEESGESIDLN